MTFSKEQFTLRVRVMQIICAALLCGVVVLFGISAIIVQNDGPLAHPPDPDALPILSVVALVMLGFTVPLSLIVPKVMLRNAVQQVAAGTWVISSGAHLRPYATDEGQLLASRQSALIVSSALLEGSGMMGGIAYMMEGQSLAVIAVVVPVLLMFWQFLTATSIRDWLERHLGLVAELRRLGKSFDVQ